MRSVEIDEVTLPMALIGEYGVDGGYVASDHTLAHFRELWQPALLDRGLPVNQPPRSPRRAPRPARCHAGGPMLLA